MSNLKDIWVTEGAGPMTASEAAEWTDAQIPYRNMAGDKRIAERAVRHVNEMVSTFQGAARPLFLRWRVLDILMSGNAIEKHQTDTHIPELYKSRETAVPRIESVFFDMQPWFRARPRKPSNKIMAEVNASYIEWQLEQARFRSLVPSLIEDLWTYQVCAAKVSWERKYLERVKREIEVKTDSESVTTKIKRKKVEEVIYDGPLVRQVNPYWFIVDPRSTNVRDAAFVGDQSEWLYSDLERYEELGLFKNVADLKQQDEDNVPLSQDQGMADFLRYSQTPTARYYAALQKTANKTARKVKLTEVWCRFDLYGDKVERECVLTIADGRVCLRAMENPFDRKMRPYAVGRSARTGHSFFGVGQMDNAVRLQIDYDRYSAIAMRIAKLIANPITFVEADADLPNSIHLLPEGAILKGVGNVNMTRMPNTLELISFVFGHYERQIAETTGVPKILEGSPQGGTATEVMRLTQEGNRRIQGVERRFGEFLQDMLEIIQQLNVQFTTAKTAFPVIGKRTRMLGAFSSIGPETMLQDVDYELVGINAMQSYGVKATALQNILVGAMPLIQVNAANVDTLSFLREMVEASLGSEMADRLIKTPKPVEEFMTQDEENAMLLRGLHVEVDEEDDDAQHLRDMAKLLEHQDELPDAILIPLKEHERQHIVKLQRREAQQKIIQQRQERSAAALPQSVGGEQGEDGKASPVAGGLQPLPGQTPGENPGPADMQKMGKAGRQGPVMQDQGGDDGY